MEAGRISSRGRGGDAREWDEEGYRRSILLERELSYRIVFRTAFAPSENPNPEIVLVASSDGSISAYSISSCISSCPRPMLCSKEVDQKAAPDVLSVGPLCSIQAHKGPSYDLKIYGNDEEALLLSCGDDGCIRGWKWADVHMAAVQGLNKGEKLSPILELVNPQKEGPWGALSPIPENNAIAVDKEDGSIFSAAGDSCAYWWDVETGKRKVVFKGHSDYLHSVVRKSSNQIITGSEDGTARVWDCRSGRCAQVINPQKSCKLKESSWISSVALDKSESWLVCGTGRGLSAWSLISYECIFSYDSHVPIQDVLFHDNQILAVGSEPVLRCFSINGKILSQIQCAPCSAFSISVHPSGVTAIGGYGGLVDVISEFGSHLCIFCCKTADSVWKI